MNRTYRSEVPGLDPKIRDYIYDTCLEVLEHYWNCLEPYYHTIHFVLEYKEATTQREWVKFGEAGAKNSQGFIKLYVPLIFQCAQGLNYAITHELAHLVQFGGEPVPEELKTPYWNTFREQQVLEFLKHYPPPGIKKEESE